MVRADFLEWVRHATHGDEVRAGRKISFYLQDSLMMDEEVGDGCVPGIVPSLGEVLVPLFYVDTPMVVTAGFARGREFGRRGVS